MTRSRCEEILESFELVELEIMFNIIEHALKQCNPNYEPVNLAEMEIDISRAKHKKSAFPKCVRKRELMTDLRDHIIDTFIIRRDTIRKKTEAEVKR